MLYFICPLLVLIYRGTFKLD